MAYLLAMHPANRVRELRKRAGLSQLELANRTGVSQPMISKIENEESLSVDIGRMRAIARELGCRPADLLSDEDNPDRLTDEEREHLANFRNAQAAQRELIRRVAEPVQPFATEPKRDAA